MGAGAPCGLVFAVPANPSAPAAAAAAARAAAPVWAIDELAIVGGLGGGGGGAGAAGIDGAKNDIRRPSSDQVVGRRSSAQHHRTVARRFQGPCRQMDCIRPREQPSGSAYVLV